MSSPLEALSLAWTLAVRPRSVARAHHLQVLVSERCGLACAGCATEGLRPRRRPDLAPRDLVRLLERLAPREVTLLGEGDPLLHPELDELVRLARASGARVHLASNLSVGDRPRLHTLRAMDVHSVKVQVAHSDARRYGEIKGRDLFASVLERVGWLLEPVEGLSRPSVLLEFWFEPDGVHELREHLLLAHARGVRRVHFLPRRGEHHRGPQPLDGSGVRHLRDAAALARELRLDTNLAALVERASAAAPAPAPDAPVGAPPCALPWLRAFVDLDGRLGPCADLVSKARSHPEIALAAAFDTPRPFDDAAMRAVRDDFRAGRAPHAICEGCAKGRLGSLWSAGRLRRSPAARA